jgi:hypothetical protein
MRPERNIVREMTGRASLLPRFVRKLGPRAAAGSTGQWTIGTDDIEAFTVDDASLTATGIRSTTRPS